MTPCVGTDDAYFELQHMAANCDSVTPAGLALKCQAFNNLEGSPNAGTCSFYYLVGVRNFGFNAVILPENPIYSNEVTLLLIAAAFVACVKFVIK